jgi:RNA polymerase sigma factor (sigma-70 family)
VSTGAASPFRAALDEGDAADVRDAQAAAAGDGAALEGLLRRHQRWVYAIAMRMVRSPDDAADLTQEALIRVVTRIGQFEARSSFRTWAYRIVVRCLLDAKRTRSEERYPSFVAFGTTLDALEDIPLDASLEPERAYLVEETHVGCMLGMLLCLDREQRITYILGDIFEASSELGAEILEISPAAFRKRLERARKDLASFTQDRCGLVDEANPCRCPKKTAALVREGWVDPRNMRFAGPNVRAIHHAAPELSRKLRVLRDDVVAEHDKLATLFQEHPLYEGPDVAGTLSRWLNDASARR